jgi:hypothetical protein
METRIELTPNHFLLIVTESDDTSQIYVGTRLAGGKEKLDFYGEHTKRNILDWSQREMEAHLHTIEYAQRQIIQEWDIGGKLLSGKFVPGGEVYVAFHYA